MKNLARPNRFLVEITTPTGVSAFKFEEKDQYYVRSANLPGKTIGDITNLFWFGENYKIAGDPTFEDLTLKFLDQFNHGLRLKFLTWMEAIASTVSNERGEPGDYKTVITLHQLDNANNTMATCYCHGAYPKIVGPIEVGQDQNDAVEEFDVTFSIDTFTNSPVAGSGSGVNVSATIK